MTSAPFLSISSFYLTNRKGNTTFHSIKTQFRVTLIPWITIELVFNTPSFLTSLYTYHMPNIWKTHNTQYLVYCSQKAVNQVFGGMPCLMIKIQIMSDFILFHISRDPKHHDYCPETQTNKHNLFKGFSKAKNNCTFNNFYSTFYSSRPKIGTLQILVEWWILNTERGMLHWKEYSTESQEQ